MTDNRVDAIPATQIRTLELAEPHSEGGCFVSAASGLTIIDGHFAVAADDAHHIALFARGTNDHGQIRRLVDGEVPTDPVERKKRKPDFEALTVVPATTALPHGGLLVVGSGSTSSREVAVIIELDERGGLGERVHLRDLGWVYARWRDACGELNVETAFVLGADLVMVSRGHGTAPDNHIARFPLGALTRWLNGTATEPIEPDRLTSIRLGNLDGVPLCITDGAPHPDGGWVFSAVAEDTSDSYNDGAVVGAGIGTMTARDELTTLARLTVDVKVEGIVAERLGPGETVVTMVTDADDPAVAASLLTASLPEA